LSLSSAGQNDENEFHPRPSTLQNENFLIKNAFNVSSDGSNGMLQQQAKNRMPSEQ
jgi:hypothetical protein